MILRPTTLATQSNLLNYILTNQREYNSYAEQVSTGERIQKPSDSPVEAATILNVDKQLSQLDGYVKNMDLAENELNVLDNNLAFLTSNLQKAKDYAIQAANETNSAASRDALKQQIDQIIENIVGIGNTQYNGSYMFGGTSVGQPPFQELPGGGYEYVGTAQDKAYQRNIPIADGVSVPVNVPGDKLLGSYDVATGTGSGILKSLYELSDSIATDNTAGIRASIDEIQTGLDNTSSIRTNFASVVSRFEMTRNSIDTSVLQLTEYKSSMKDVDISEAIMKLKNQQLALNASMQVTAVSMKTANLLNYI